MQFTSIAFSKHKIKLTEDGKYLNKSSYNVWNLSESIKIIIIVGSFVFCTSWFDENHAFQFSNRKNHLYFSFSLNYISKLNAYLVCFAMKFRSDSFNVLVLATQPILAALNCFGDFLLNVSLNSYNI